MNINIPYFNLSLFKYLSEDNDDRFFVKDFAKEAIQEIEIRAMKK